MTPRYSRRAIRQLDEILAYVAAENERAAGKILARFDTLGGFRARHPLVGRPTDLENLRVFRATPYPYLIFYHTDPMSGDVTILRIRHTARKQDWREGR